MVWARSKGVVLCGATTSSHSQAPPVGVFPYIPPEIWLSSSGPVAAGQASLVVSSGSITEGREVSALDTMVAATASAAPPAASQAWTRRRDRSIRPTAIPTSR